MKYVDVYVYNSFSFRYITHKSHQYSENQFLDPLFILLTLFILYYRHYVVML